MISLVLSIGPLSWGLYVAIMQTEMQFDITLWYVIDFWVCSMQISKVLRPFRPVVSGLIFATYVSVFDMVGKVQCNLDESCVNHFYSIVCLLCILLLSVCSVLFLCGAAAIISLHRLFLWWICDHYQVLSRLHLYYNGWNKNQKIK